MNSSKISNLQLLHSFCYAICLFSTFRFSFTTDMITCRFHCLKVVLYTDSRLEVPLQMGSLRERFATHDAAKFFHPAALVPVDDRRWKETICNVEISSWSSSLAEPRDRSGSKTLRQNRTFQQFLFTLSLTHTHFRLGNFGSMSIARTQKLPTKEKRERVTVVLVKGGS